MSNYYYSIVFMTVAMMVTSIIHLFENETLSRNIKKQLIIIASLIAAGVICEFFGIFLNNVPSGSKIIHGIVKATEYSVAPILPICYVKIVEGKYLGKFVNIATNILVGINVISEVISIFIPFVFYIDENNVYRHGSYYLIYMISYYTGTIVFIIGLLNYTRKYQSRNIATLTSLLAFLLIGSSIRLIDSTVYLDWLVIAITYLFFIIYYSDVSLKVDSLTHLFNRKSYEYRLRKLDYSTAILVFDVNEFKQINDTYGHQAGDTALKLIAKAILKAYGKYGYCYRIGGDEFCVILKSGVFEDFTTKSKNMNTSDALDKLNATFDKILEQQNEEFPMLINGVSKGYAFFCGHSDSEFMDDLKNNSTFESLKEVIELADKRIYEDKKRRKS